MSTATENTKSKAKNAAPKKKAASTKTAAPKKKKKAKRRGPIGRKDMSPPVPTLDKLRELHPDAHCELVHDGPFQLLVATVLSAQTTDVAVNKATPKLFADFPDAKSMAAVESKVLEPYVSTLGFFRMKAKSLVGLSKKIVELFGGEVPNRLDDLVKLPGVGRKTANVVLGVIWNTPEGVVVDTHVQRISQRLGWTRHKDPVDIEQDLMELIPKDQWDIAAHLLIFHGRRICFAEKPNCEGCGLSTTCPSAFKAEKIGRKPKRDRGPKPAKGALKERAKKAVKRGARAIKDKAAKVIKSMVG